MRFFWALFVLLLLSSAATGQEEQETTSTTSEEEASSSSSSSSSDSRRPSGFAASRSLRHFAVDAQLRNTRNGEAFSFDRYDTTPRARKWLRPSADIPLTSDDMATLFDTLSVLAKGDVFVVLFYTRWDPFSQRVVPVYRAAAEAFGGPRLYGGLEKEAVADQRGEDGRNVAASEVAEASLAPGFIPFFSVDAAAYSSYNSRFGVSSFPKILVCNVSAAAVTPNVDDWLANRPTVFFQPFNMNSEKLRSVHKNTGVDTIDLRLFTGFVELRTGINHTVDYTTLEVRMPPLGRPTPEADIFLYLSVALVVGVAFYGLHVSKVTHDGAVADVKRD